ncbi:MAG TPA: SDR family oxidoreductase [Trueperaceae bacterium]|nr:SDR family oxidoreductase [Trueperaceae bacterium]
MGLRGAGESGMAGDLAPAALVTGGASGIGLAIVERLVADGFAVVATDVAAEIGSRAAARAGARFVPADLTEPGACERVVQEAVAGGRLDALVCCAGYQHIDALPDFPADRWRHMLELMLTAPFLLTKHAWPHLTASDRGRIVHVGSAHSLTASPFKAAYVSAKHGLVGLARTTALEGGRHGVTCNVVAPAYTRTPLVSAQVADQARTRGISEAEVEEQVFLSGVAIKRMLEPADVAGLVSYLVSREAWGVTGTVHSIDLGWTAR